MSATGESTPPIGNQVEQWVCDACRDLGLPVESVSDDFFLAGGTSLTLIRLVARAEALFGEDCLPPDDIFEHSSLRDIAASIIRNAASTATDHGVATTPSDLPPMTSAMSGSPQAHRNGRPEGCSGWGG